MKKEKVLFDDLLNDGMKELISLYEHQFVYEGDDEMLDSVVEHICGNLIGEKVIVLNHPENDYTVYAVRELFVTRVEKGFLYGLDDSVEIKLHIPYNYIYHPAILAALKCL